MGDNFDPWDFSSPGIDAAPDGWSSAIGPQYDGTYAVPPAAQQVNKPANTAGYSSPMSQQTYNLLSQGINGALNLFALDKMVDYKKYEATNGGLFMQGRGAYGYQTQVNPNYSMLLLLVAGLVIALKD